MLSRCASFAPFWQHVHAHETEGKLLSDHDPRWTRDLPPHIVTASLPIIHRPVKVFQTEYFAQYYAVTAPAV
jgi:hypothetical protein